MSNVKLELGPIKKADLPKLLEWRNDWRIWKWTRQNDLLNEAAHAEWFERQAKDSTVRMYAVNAKFDGSTAMVGVCGFTSLDFANRRAEFSFYIAPQFHRLGFGKMGLKLLFNHGFGNLGLNLIWGETFDGNPAEKLFQAIGLQREGTRRQFYWKDGSFINCHLYSVLRDEWYGNLSGHDRLSDNPVDASDSALSGAGGDYPGGSGVEADESQGRSHFHTIWDDEPGFPQAPSECPETADS